MMRILRTIEILITTTLAGSSRLSLDNVHMALNMILINFSRSVKKIINSAVGEVK